MPFVRRQRTYYKYAYRDWVQPVLTANGTLGVNSFAVYCNSNTSYPPFYAFDNNSSTFATTSNNDFIIYSKNALNITAISFTNRGSSYVFKGGEIYGSNDGEDWKLIQTVSGDSWDLSSNTEYYNYYKIVQTVSANWQIIQFTITAMEQYPVELNINEDAAYEDWIQPVLTANDSDPSFIVDASSVFSNNYAAWKSFQANKSSRQCWRSDSVDTVGLPQYYTITTDRPLKVSTITIKNVANIATAPIGVWQASKDNVNWIDIVEFAAPEYTAFASWSFEPNETIGYKYHRFKITSKLGGAKYIPLGFPTITAKILKKEEDIIAEADYHVDNNKMYNLTKRYREYYKYGTELDVTAEGSFGKIDKGVASGFSTADYLLLHEDFDVTAGQSWEMVFKVTTGGDISTAQAIVGNTTANYDPVWMAVQSSKFRIVLSSSTSSSILDKTGTYVLTANTTYWVRLTFDGATYNLDYSLDGLEYINDITFASTKTIHPRVPAIGISLAEGSKKYPFLGSVYLNESHISINGERWWSGDSYTKVGSWIEKGIVGSFTTAKYLINNKGVFNTKQPWESVISFTTGSDISTTQTIRCNTIGYCGYGVGVTSGKLRVTLSSSTSSHNIIENKDVAVLANTKYWVRTVFNGENYTCTYSTDGKNYLEVFSLDSTTKVSSGIPRYGLSDSSKAPFLGTIDFSESYIKIDGEFWWRGLGGIGGGTYTATDGWGNVANAFDHISNTYATCATSTDYIEYDFGREVYVNGFIATGQFVSSGSRPMDLRMYSVDDNGNETLLGNGTGSAATSVYTTKTIFPRVKTSKVRFRLTETNYEGNPPLASVPTRIREIRILGSIIGTESDYDYYVDTKNSYSLTKKQRTYYKEVVEEWEQPVLDSDGVMGGSQYACVANVTTGAAYKAFDNNTKTIAGRYTGAGGKPTLDVIFYSPNKINVTELQIYWISDPAQSNGRFKNIYCYGRNSEDEEWVQIGQYPDGSGLTAKWLTMDCSSNTGFYRYHKFTSTQSTGAEYNDSNYLGELKYIGTQKVPYLSTKDDYDYYVDTFKIY